MSWSFEFAGHDKAALATAVQQEIAHTKTHHKGHETIIEKVGDLVLAALEHAEPIEHYAFRVRSSGHVDAQSADGSFEIRRIKIT